MKYNLDKLIKYASMFAYEVDGQISFDFDIMDKPKIIEVKEDVNKLELEKEVLGYYVSEFPLEKERDNLKKLGCVNSNEFTKFNNKNIKWVGLLKSSKVIRTKKGELMSLATFIDECGEINVVIFPRVYSEVSKIMYVNKYYLLEGKIEVKETISLIANNLDEYKLGE
jgi:DNA polymerase-3 subunit alpha